MRIAKVLASWAKLLAIVPLAVLPLGMGGCGGSQPQPKPTSEQQSSTQSPQKRYHLEGTVVSIDRQQKRVVVDGKDIPGFMAAMTMPYPVVDDQTLDRLKPGDQITADIVGSGSDMHLDNVVVVKKSDSQK